MPTIRRQLAEELNQRGLTYERVLATALRMLDLGVFRVGGEEYAPTVAQDAEDLDGSYGLATVRRDHVRLNRGAVVFCYPAKGGAERYLTLHDSVLYQVIRALLRRRGGGEELLAYRVGRDWHDVKAHDVNARLKQLAGVEFSAKDLRTWNATVLAAVALAVAGEDGVPGSQRARAKLVNAALDEVAEHLGNTRAVARASYVDPRVVECFEQGRTILPALRRIGTPDLSDETVRHALERAVLRLLRS